MPEVPEGSAAVDRADQRESATDVRQLSYATAGRELDAIIEEFETGVVDVDRLVDQLERATQIVDELDRRLRRTRMRVEELVPRLEAVGRGDPPTESPDEHVEEASPGRPDHDEFAGGEDEDRGDGRGPQGLF
jgi:exodeoxyribonuclease VII small subunit